MKYRTCLSVSFFYGINVEYRDSMSEVDRYKYVMHELGTTCTRSSECEAFLVYLESTVKVSECR